MSINELPEIIKVENIPDIVGRIPIKPIPGFEVKINIKQIIENDNQETPCFQLIPCKQKK